MDNEPRYKIIDIPVVHGIATLPDGRTVRSESKVVRFPLLVGELTTATFGEEEAEPGADSLDAAWAEAEAALPEGWYWGVVSTGMPGDDAYRASASPNGWVMDDHHVESWAATPAAALRALAVKLKEPDRE